MADFDKRKPKRPPLTPASEVVSRIVERGGFVYYARKALLPVLELEVLVREMSREQLGVLEQAVLQLVGSGVRTTAALARLLGIAQHRLNVFVLEFVQRGLMDRGEDGRLALSETGRLCIVHGREVVDVRRAVLLSGLTGELLPTCAYQLDRMTPELLGRRGGSHHLLVESTDVPLAGLDISRIADKRAVNLAEETQAILGRLGGHRASFLECFVAVYGDAATSQPSGVEVWLNDAQLSDAPLTQIIPYLEPYGFGHRGGAEGALQELARELRQAGSQIEQVDLDRLGNPQMVAGYASDALLSSPLHGRCLAYYAGTAMQPALPITELWLGAPKPRERLSGRSLGLWLREPAQAFEAERIRQVHDAVDRYFADPARRVDSRAALHAAIEPVCEMEEVRALATKWTDRRITGVLARAFGSSAR